MSNWQQQVKNNPYFCVLPFSHIHFTTDGKANACCMANFNVTLSEDIKGSTVQDIWTGAKYQELRTAMLEGKRHSQCEICYKQDEEGGGSDRQTMNRFFNAPSADWDVDVVNGNTDGHPLSVDMRPGRFCNLGCRMCFVAVSSYIADEHKKHPELTSVSGEKWFDVEEWIDDPVMYASIQELIPNLRSIKLAGGESLFMPGVIKLLSWCVESGNTHLHLDITTNGTRTQGKIIKMLSKFKAVDIQYSIDGIGAVNEYIRYPSEWSVIDESYKRYKQMDNVKSVNILSTVQIYNAFELVNIIDYWMDNGAQDNLIFNFVNWPRDLAVDILPLEDRQEIARQIQDRASKMTEAQRQQFRVDALVYRLNQTVESFNGADLDTLRKNFSARTKKYDEIRKQDINTVSKRLAQYVNDWA